MVINRRILILLLILILTQNGFTDTSADSLIQLSITYKDGSKEEKAYDKYDKKILFYKTNINRIEGLNQFNQIEELIFRYTAFITDFSFLENLNNVKILVLDMVEIDDLSFLSTMKELQGIIIQNSRFEICPLKLGSKLEYLEFSNCSLLEIPNLVDVPCSIKIINLAYNNINSIDTPAINGNIDYIMTGNPVKSNYPNFITESNFYEKIPFDYRKYIK